MLQLSHNEFLKFARRTQRLGSRQNMEALDIFLVASQQVLPEQLDQL